MKIIIVGAGIGGLAAGIALKRLGHDVRIYEQAPAIRPVGAAISIWPNGVKCLNYLGLGQEIARMGGRLNRMAYVDGLTGETMTHFGLEQLVEQVGERPYPVSRAELQAMLMREFGERDITLGARLAQIHEGGEKVVGVFEGGGSDDGDILIGADGAHSVVRNHVLGKTVERRYAGYVNWNGIIHQDRIDVPADRWTTFVGQGKRVSFMPIGDQRLYFFFDVPLPAGLPNDKSAYKADLGHHFSGWASAVKKLIQELDPETTNRVEIFDLDPFEKWTKGRVALLGDAAHNTTPDIGQGGCMALEDAIVLATTLQTHSLGVEDALSRYERRRVNRTSELVLKARKRSDVTHAHDPVMTQAWYDELRTEDGRSIIRGIAANVESGPLQ